MSNFMSPCKGVDGVDADANGPITAWARTNRRVQIADEFHSRAEAHIKFAIGPKLIKFAEAQRAAAASPIGRRHKPPSQRLALRPVSAEEGSCIIRRKEAVSAEEEAVSAEEAILTLLSSRNSFLVTPYTLSRALSTQRPRRPSWSSVLPAVSSLRRTASNFASAAHHLKT